ncbi:MAG TPA: hypothetical protein VLH39_08065 [Magnetospirillaceae bacterium]|nr:hypothetical protein [Magnetospirillaceae bacterium]
MTILLIVLTLAVLCVAAFFFSSRAMRKACMHILEDLKRRKATESASAVELPYCKRQLLQFGLRDYRPDALNFLLRSDFVRMSEEGKFYLGKPAEPGEDGKGLFRPQA